MRQFLAMSPEEAEGYLRQHIAVADEVIARFRDRLRSIAGLSPDVFDFSDKNLDVIWGAVKPLYAEREVDIYDFGGDDPPLWLCPEASGPNQFPRHLWWLRDGLIHYVSKCWMALSPELRWDWEKDQLLYTANEPVIAGGFDGLTIAPIGVVSVMAGGFLYCGPFGNKEPQDRFMESYHDLAKKAPILGEPAVDDRYEPEEVEVRVAAAEQIQLETITPDRPADWEGTWSVWLPEGVDVVCRPGTKEALEKELLGRPEVSRVGYADPDTLLVDAPGLTAIGMREMTLDFLNTRRSSD